MRRGQIVTIADPSGDFSSKHRPALIVQSDLYNETHASITVCLITSHLTGLSLFRVPVTADAQTGLKHPSEVEVDKLQSVWTHRVGKIVGRAPGEVMTSVEQALKNWLSL